MNIISRGKTPHDKRNKRVPVVLWAGAVAAAIFCIIWWRASHVADNRKTKIYIHELATAGNIRPSLTVSAVSPAFQDWPITLGANGNIAAWQEASVGAEVNGLRLTEVRVNVGDQVRRGQVLAEFANETVKADVAQAEAAVAEADALLAQAKANAARARQVQTPGVISAQQIGDYIIGERAAAARLEAAQAQLANQRTRLRHTLVVAPDDGVISARAATVGAVVGAGQELFRLIRENRLEWRGEFTASELHVLQPGQAVMLSSSGESLAKGVVRMVGPTVDPQTRLGLVYVDIPSNNGLKAGMFAHGNVEIGRKTVMTLPESAVVQREGFSYVFLIEAGNRIKRTKVDIGRRFKDRIEIVRGIEKTDSIVADGVAFLADGDKVRIAAPSEIPAGSSK